MKKLFICALLTLPAIAFAADSSPAPKRLADIPLQTIVQQSEVGELRPLTTRDAQRLNPTKPRRQPALKKNSDDSYRKTEITFVKTRDGNYAFSILQDDAMYNLTQATEKSISSLIAGVFVQQ